MIQTITFMLFQTVETLTPDSAGALDRAVKQAYADSAATLDLLLNDGFTVIHSGTVNEPSRVYVWIVLFKPNPPTVSQNRRHLDTSQGYPTK